ncbi:hypothetical protein EXU30_13085 [Shewanella maritima]|uniref:Zinc-regulated TonB-dependent outer membrane receptor n=1 Tax=Shewanella maritima TaxID=2520507 RepID=A0A411PIU6_9GAMM|nr:hypothetical protein [Shewanella maritima]QBF83521.1 hypothetical protein EXU30_13085 [Shewanella maritima]
MSLTTRVSLVALSCAFATAAQANTGTLSNPNISAVLDGYYQTGERPMAERTEGFGLGETELAISANIDDSFYGKVTAILESHDGETEINLEEAFIQTLALPGGLSVRGGRFLSDIGYLNNQHKHTDSFTDRPVVYRSFLGNHYFDDGIRLNYVAPTDLYWTMGVEAFAGDKMRAADEHGERDFKTVGVYTAYTKFGGDIGQESSWQLGLSYLRNENGVSYLEEHEEHEEHAAEEHGHDDHGHSHSAAYTGKNMFVADFTFKWAPDGNYKYQNLTLSGEYFRVTDIFAEGMHEEHEEEHEHEEHEEEHHEHEVDFDAYNTGWYLSGVYKFSPSWSAGVRYGQVDLHEAHEDHLDKLKLKETEVMVAYHPSHFSVIRLQYTKQDGVNHFGIEDDNIFTLQYNMTLGAHGAHQF